MNLETKITIYKFTPQVFTLTHSLLFFLLIYSFNIRTFLMIFPFFVQY